MIESLFVRKHAIAKHQSGPLLKEREEFLQYLATQDMHPNFSALLGRLAAYLFLDPVQGSDSLKGLPRYGRSVRLL
jgi:hypothetical protein